MAEYKDEKAQSSITVTDAVEGPGIGMTTNDLNVRTEEKREQQLQNYIQERRGALYQKTGGATCSPDVKDIEFPVDVNVVLSCGLDIKDKDIIEVGWPLKGKKIQTKLRYEDGKFWTTDKDFLDVHGAAYGISMESLREMLASHKRDVNESQAIWKQIHAINDKLQENGGLPKDYAEIVARFEANSSLVTALRKEVAELYTQFPPKSSLKDMKDRIDGIFAQYKIHQSRNNESIRNLRRTVEKHRSIMDGIGVRVSKIEKPDFQEGLDILKAGKHKQVEKDLSMTVPSSPPQSGDHLVFNGKEWVCDKPIAVKPTPQVWLGPRMAMGALLFSPAMLLGPLLVMVARVTVAATVPTKAHNIPGFRKTLRGFARFVFKEDMNWKHLLAFGPIATAETFAVVEAVNYFGLTLPW